MAKSRTRRPAGKPGRRTTRRTTPRRAFIRLGPGGGGGQIRPVVSPHDPDVAFITCDMTGWFQTTDGGQSWRNINLKGVVHASAFDGGDPKCIYAGNSGLYRSNDAGRTWRLVFPAPDKVTAEVQAYDHANHRYESSDNWPGGMILGIAVDPGDSKIIYVAIYRAGVAPGPMTERVGQLAQPTGGEILVFVSRDYGGTFARLAAIGGIDPRGALGDNHAVKVLHVDASSPAADRRLILVTHTGLARISAATGAVEGGTLPEGVERIDQASIGRDKTTARPVVYITAPSRWQDAATLVGGVYRSDDAGQSWRQINNGLLEGVCRPGAGEPPQFNCVAVAASDADIAYVECRSHPEKPRDQAVWGHPFGVFKTTDGGRHWCWCLRMAWDQRALNVTRECWLTRWGGPGAVGTGIHLAVAPSDPRVVWRVTAMCSLRTADGGKTWQETYSKWRPDGSCTTNGMDVTTCYGVHFDPHVPKRAFITYTDISLFRSDDGGKGWFLNKGGIPNAWRNTCYWLCFDPDVRDRMWSVWSGTHDLPRPKMFGGDWSKRVGGVAFSGDGGRSWHPTTTGMPDESVPTHVILDPDSPAGSRRLYVAVFARGVYRSDNDGRSWQLKNNGIDPANLYAWRLALAKDGALYACIARGGQEDGAAIDGAVYRSTDHAESWARLALPEGASAPNDLAIDPRNPRRLYLACWPRTVNGYPAGGGVWGSDDAGATWRRLLDDKLHCYAVTIDPARQGVAVASPERPDRLYVCGFNGSIFRSDNRGRSWRRLSGYNFKWGHRVIPDPYHKHMIYVTTFGGSVFYGPADGTGAEFEDILPF